MLVQAIQRAFLQTERARPAWLALLDPQNVALVVEQRERFRCVVVDDEFNRFQRGNVLGKRARKLLNARGCWKVVFGNDVPVWKLWTPCPETGREGVRSEAVVEVDCDLDMPKLGAEVCKDMLDSGLQRVSEARCQFTEPTNAQIPSFLNL